MTEVPKSGEGTCEMGKGDRFSTTTWRELRVFTLQAVIWLPVFLGQAVRRVFKPRNLYPEQRVEYVIYTAISLGYDNPPHVQVIDPGISYILFSDDPELVAHPPWKVTPFSYENPDPKRSVSYHKILSHRVLTSETISVWVDGNFDSISIDRHRIDRWLGKADMAMMPHMRRSRLASEADEVLRLGLCDPDSIARWRVDAAEQGILGQKRFAASGLLVRRSSDSCKAFEAEWWNRYDRGPRRDQLSLASAIHECGPHLHWIPIIWWRRNKYFTRHRHLVKR